VRVIIARVARYARMRRFWVCCRQTGNYLETRLGEINLPEAMD
jgi:hypothetical protein